MMNNKKKHVSIEITRMIISSFLFREKKITMPILNLARWLLFLCALSMNILFELIIFLFSLKSFHVILIERVRNYSNQNQMTILNKIRSNE